MRLQFLVSFVGVALIIFEVDATASDLYRRWGIAFPSVSLSPETNTITIDYGISDELTSDNVRTKIMTDDCQGPQITQGILSDALDKTTSAHTFRIDIQTLVTNETISTISPSGENGTMTFCLRYELWSADEEDDSAIEINYLLNLLTIYLRADGEFVLDAFLVTEIEPNDDDDLNEKLEKEKHILDCYLCHPVTHDPIPPPPNGFGKGEVVSICTEASQTVIDDNMVLKGVEYFVWRRTYMWGGIPTVQEQWAVKDGVADPLSSYNCPPNALICTFTTMLNAEFFSSAGSVEGIGSTSLEFGSRKLVFRINDYSQKGSLDSSEAQPRELQEDLDTKPSNMAIRIPIRGPDVRPRVKVPLQKDHISPWLLWLLMALIFFIVFALSAGLYWSEWRGGTRGKPERQQQI